MSRAYTRAGVIAYPVLALLLGAAAYEAAIALEWVSMGSEPGEGATGEGIAWTAGMLALLVGMGYFALQLLRREVRVPSVAPLIPVAAAAFMTARVYSFDPYYLPTLRRFSEHGDVPDVWIYGLDACSLIVAAAVRLWPRTGSLAASILLLLCLSTVFGSAIGH